MSKNLSAKYYQENKERLQKKACERYQNISEEKKEKRNNMVVSITKISQKVKKTNWLSIEKNIKCEKMSYYNYYNDKKVF